MRGSRHGAVQEGDDLGAFADDGGAEVGGIHAAGDVILHRPQYGFVEIILGLYVLEGIRVTFLACAACSPQEGHDLTAGAGIGGREGGLAG